MQSESLLLTIYINNIIPTKVRTECNTRPRKADAQNVEIYAGILGKNSS